MLLKLVCISIFCVFCLFGRTQLPVVAAVPFEYNEDREQYPYDLETEQSKAQYNTRILSQQLQKEHKSSEESIDNTDDHLYNEEKAYIDDLQPHERAASCYTREHKYTHGQKVSRLDPCEVCLCMDGEIFCWWEKCEKRKPQELKKINAKNTELRHTRKMLTKSKTLTSPMASQLQGQPINGEDRAISKTHINKHFSNPGNQHITKSLKKQLHQQNAQGQYNQERQKIKQQQEQQHQKHQEQQLQQQQKQQQQHQQPELQKSHMHDKHSLSSSKIMNFPENLPSVLYYDYHTEEHEHHQHQHHQQHLKHQLQKKIQKLQREHNRQQQQQQQQQGWQQKGKHLITGSTSSLTASAVPPSTQIHHTNNAFNRNSMSSPSMFAYDDSQTDSDILPEPPTKKSLLTTASTKASISGRNATKNERQESNLYDNHADHIVRTEWSPNFGTDGETRRLFVGETSATSSIFATDDVVEINKNINKSPQRISNHQAFNTMNTEGNNSNIEAEQDDAFHRWLTSTETYNNNNNNKVNNDKTNKNNNDSYNDENFSYDNENLFATESSEFENPFGILNLTKNSRHNIPNNNNNNNNFNDNNTINNRSNKLLYSKDQERAKNAENGFLHGAFNNDDSDYNGSVVNIDILLTTQDELRQQQQLHPNLPKQAELEELLRTPASIMFAAGLILDRGDTRQTAKTINDTRMSVTQMGGPSPEGNTKQNSVQTETATLAMTALTTKTPSSYVQFIRHNGTDFEEGTGTTTATTTTTTTSVKERQCNVMGTLYKIGEVLPQDTGNCLQCICIDGSTSDDTPRVTCSPHNCPPLVLPDLFDATGY